MFYSMRQAVAFSTNWLWLYGEQPDYKLWIHVSWPIPDQLCYLHLLKTYWRVSNFILLCLDDIRLWGLRLLLLLISDNGLVAIHLFFFVSTVFPRSVILDCIEFWVIDADVKVAISRGVSGDGGLLPREKYSPFRNPWIRFTGQSAYLMTSCMSNIIWIYWDEMM